MVESMDRSRHIPADIRVAVIEESRGRCCLCRQPTIPGSTRRELLSDVLEKHHIIHFSKGGEHSVENLVAVCPDCHRFFHKFPEKYPAERLSKAKHHWTAMASVVNRELLYAGRAPILSNGEGLRLVRVPFRLESFGLSFEIVVPDSVSVEMYLEFLEECILKPIGQFDGDQYLANPEEAKLSHVFDTKETFSEAVKLSDVALKPGDAYVVHIHIPAVYAPVPEGTLLAAAAIVCVEAREFDTMDGERRALIQTFPIWHELVRRRYRDKAGYEWVVYTCIRNLKNGPRKQTEYDEEIECFRALWRDTELLLTAIPTTWTVVE